MNTDYLKELDGEADLKDRRNKATFHKKSKGGDLDELKFDQAGLAFRKDALKALNKDNIVFKKIDLHSYVESLRNEGIKEIFDFFSAIDENAGETRTNTAAKNLKLLYFYFVGSRNLISEMRNEAITTYVHD